MPSVSETTGRLDCCVAFPRWAGPADVCLVGADEGLHFADGTVDAWRNPWRPGSHINSRIILQEEQHRELSLELIFWQASHVHHLIPQHMLAPRWVFQDLFAFPVQKVEMEQHKKTRIPRLRHPARAHSSLRLNHD